MHSLWYAIDPIGCVYWDEYRWALTRRLRVEGINAKPKRVEAGQVIVTDGVSVRIIEAQTPHLPTARPGISLNDAIDEFWSIFLEATREMYELAGRPKVVSMLSGGTDSTLGTIALREIGADVHAVSVGRSPEYFDPAYAADYARQLDIPFTFIQLPTDDASLTDLLTASISTAETKEGTNTRMGMSTILVRRWALTQGRDCIWKGHFADDILGFSTLTQGTFRKKFPAQTDQEWSEYRASLYQHIIPNDMQVAQVCRTGSTIWRSTFTHPKVAEFVWSMPKSIVPLSLEKPLFGGACDRFLQNTSWNLENKKVPYNIGSGLWDLAKENPVLSQANMDAVYAAAKERLT
ncbi:hypothetical protein J2J97_32000 (plasmid) [Rhizobium bangladeshense]|uniref:asparagine synthase-related protein n=1 Tax=Rhizobium bangladeshense TaxID=1138189 RepID=UPI001A98DB4F|nr:asparagine synthase-related protein [Rhizobium bangladeshense]QSY98696.1 hypothetical protein J2J97_32000 [Rhizobium bangladeshense]